MLCIFDTSLIPLKKSVTAGFEPGTFIRLHVIMANKQPMKNTSVLVYLEVHSISLQCAEHGEAGRFCRRLRLPHSGPVRSLRGFPGESSYSSLH